MKAPDVLEGVEARGLTPGELDQGGIAQYRSDRAVLARRGALAPGRQLPGHRPRARVELPDPGQPLPGLLGIALVGGRFEAPALLARPCEPTGVTKSALELVAKLEQVDHVLRG